MRGFIYLAESCSCLSSEDEPQIIEQPQDNNLETILTELKDVISKLRSYMENDPNNDFALGVETGMQRASDMIERIVKNNEKEIT